MYRTLILKKLPKHLAIILYTVHWSHNNVISLWKDSTVSLSTFKYRRKTSTSSRQLPRVVSPSVTLSSINKVLLSVCLLASGSVCVQMTEEAEDLNTTLRQRSWSKTNDYKKYSASKSQDKLLNHFLLTPCAGISCNGKRLRIDLLIAIFVSLLQLQMPSLSVVPFSAGSCRNVLSSKIKTRSSSQNQKEKKIIPAKHFLACYCS